MIAAWLAGLVKYSSLSDRTLRGMYIALDRTGLMPAQRAAIATELATRAWAEAIAVVIDDDVCVWTARGGKS